MSSLSLVLSAEFLAPVGEEVHAVEDGGLRGGLVVEGAGKGVHEGAG